MIKIELTLEEADMIKEDIKTTAAYYEVDCDSALENKESDRDKEYYINRLYIAKSILNKLGVK